MERIVINLEPSCERLSVEALKLLAERTGTDYEWLAYANSHQGWTPIFNRGEIVNIVEELGERANAEYACLVIVDVPDHYRGLVKTWKGGRETVEFQWKEDYLRELIRTGDEETIVKYVKGKLY